MARRLTPEIWPLVRVLGLRDIEPPGQPLTPFPGLPCASGGGFGLWAALAPVLVAVAPLMFARKHSGRAPKEIMKKSAARAWPRYRIFIHLTEYRYRIELQDN